MMRQHQVDVCQLLVVIFSTTFDKIFCEYAQENDSTKIYSLQCHTYILKMIGVEVTKSKASENIKRIYLIKLWF